MRWKKLMAASAMLIAAALTFTACGSTGANESGSSDSDTIEKSGILLSDADLFSPQLWHATAGFLYARDVLHIADPDVLNAIRYHTTGRADMSLLEKVVYLADLTSADREYSDVREMRNLADVDLDAAMFYDMQYIIGDLVKHGKLLHPDTLACYHQIALERARRAER